MPCEHPIRAHRPANGGPVSFNGAKRDGHAYTPIEIPCGYCILCRREQARQTAVRITHEAQLWEESSFLNLTYAPEHEPPYGELRYEDLQKFWKRLRKRYGKLRYYAVGEYGGKSHRPHYHACLFGLAFTENRIIRRPPPNMLWTSPELEEAWGLGYVAVGTLNFRTARYTASYITKKLRAKQKHVRVDAETGELIPLVQPRAFMSRNLAKEWWTKHHQYTVDHDQVVIDGRPQKPPRAYDKWLKEKEEQEIERIKARRKAKAKKMSQSELSTHARNARARQKEEIHTI